MDPRACAFAPSRDLSGVRSRSISAWSTSRWSSASCPSNSGWISSTSPSTALVTALPPYSAPPSRSSTASKAPVEAPLGTPARPADPSSRTTSTSRVGFPRESRISLACTASMDAIVGSLAVSAFVCAIEPNGAGPGQPYRARRLSGMHLRRCAADLIDLMTTTRSRPDLSHLGLGEVPMVLMYHIIDEVREDPHKLAVTPARFAEQMAWLATRGLHGVSMETLLAAMRNGTERGLVGLTFDDGYLSVLE